MVIGKIVEKDRVIFESQIRSTANLEWPEKNEALENLKSMMYSQTILDVEHQRQKTKKNSDSMLKMLLNTEKLDSYKHFKFMFEAQHFPQKLAVIDQTFDTVTKKLNGEFGDENLDVYQHGPINFQGHRIKVKDLRNRKKKKDTKDITFRSGTLKLEKTDKEKKKQTPKNKKKKQKDQTTKENENFELIIAACLGEMPSFDNLYSVEITNRVSCDLNEILQTNEEGELETEMALLDK